MRSSYSRLRGVLVVGADGRRLGRLLDLVVAPEGQEMVAVELVVVPGVLALTLSRLHRPWGRPVHLPADLRSVTSDTIRMNPHD